MDKRAYWIWLQNAFGPGSPKPRLIAERAGDPERFYRMGSGFWSDCSFISDREFATLSAYGPAHAEAALEYCDKLGYTVLTPDMDEYPALLKEIYNPPAVLYVRGTLPKDGLWVTVVGTRKATEAGLAAAREFSCGLARRGVNIVSGGALGIDSEAHRGALAGGGRTVAVLPCGLDHPYLMDNAVLRSQILEQDGALCTEFPMQTPVAQGSFHIRNRILSGLAHGVLVAEAPERSGALITAKYALEQDREVFVYVGEGKTFGGCAALAEDGAKRVYAAEDVLKTFAPRQSTERRELLTFALASLRTQEKDRPPRAKAATKKSEAPKATDTARPAQTRFAEPERKAPSVSPNAAAVLAVMTDAPMHISEIGRACGLPSGTVLAALTELEIAGEIRALPGQRYEKA